MYAGRYVDIKKAQKEAEAQKKIRLREITVFQVAQNCKVSMDREDICLKCGMCGRKFNEFGEVI